VSDASAKSAPDGPDGAGPSIGIPGKNVFNGGPTSRRRRASGGQAVSAGLSTGPEFEWPNLFLEQIAVCAGSFQPQRFIFPSSQTSRPASQTFRPPGRGAHVTSAGKLATIVARGSVPRHRRHATEPRATAAHFQAEGWNRRMKCGSDRNRHIALTGKRTVRPGCVPCRTGAVRRC
jgi:hypothetical protein